MFECLQKFQRKVSARFINSYGDIDRAIQLIDFKDEQHTVLVTHTSGVRVYIIYRYRRNPEVNLFRVMDRNGLSLFTGIITVFTVEEWMDMSKAVLQYVRERENKTLEDYSRHLTQVISGLDVKK